MAIRNPPELAVKWGKTVPLRSLINRLVISLVCIYIYISHDIPDIFPYISPPKPLCLNIPSLQSLLWTPPPPAHVPSTLLPRRWEQQRLWISIGTNTWHHHIHIITYSSGTLFDNIGICIYDSDKICSDMYLLYTDIHGWFRDVHLHTVSPSLVLTLSNSERI